MAKQDAFTSDEWSLIRLAPALVSGGVSAAEPSGIFGGVRVSANEQAFIEEVRRATGA